MCDFNCDTCTLDVCEDCEDILADIDERDYEMVKYDNYLKAKTPGQKNYRRYVDRYKAYAKKNYEANREKHKAYCRRYYNNHIDKERERTRKYYHDHAEQKKAYHKEYRAKHREYYRQIEYNRRIVNREKYNAYMRVKGKEYRIRNRIRREMPMLEAGRIIRVSCACVEDYIKELAKCGITAIHRPDLTKGKVTRLEITAVEPRDCETYQQAKERINGRTKKGN